MGDIQIYTPSTTGRIRQCEIFADFTHFIPRFDDPKTVDPVVRSYVIVMTQDCDLEQDFNLRSENGENTVQKSQHLPFVTLVELQTEDRLRKARPYLRADLMKRIRANNDERYQYLRQLDKTMDFLQEGSPALVADLKRSFTVETDYIYHLINTENLARRAVVVTPYAESILSRFGYYISRIAIPSPHYVKEEAK